MNNRKLWVSILAGIMAFVMVLGLIVSLIPTKAKAATSSEIKDQIAELEKQNEQMQAQLDALKGQQTDNLNEIEAAVAQKNLIEHEIGLLQAQIDNQNQQIAAYNVLIADKQEELDEAEAKLAKLNEENKERIRAMEEGGQISYWSVIFSANSFSDLLDRLNMIDEIGKADRRRLEEMRAVAAEIENAKQELVAERELLQKVKNELGATQLALEAKQKEIDDLMIALIAKGEEFKHLMHEYEGDLSELEDAIGKMEADLEEQLYKEYLATMTTATKPIYSGGGYSSNAGIGVIGTQMTDDNGIVWLIPCDYRKVSSPFGMRMHPVYHVWRMHNGVDLDADCLMHKDGVTTDSPIIATRDGVVVNATWSDSGGWYVTIDHMDGYKSTYLHMCSKPVVAVGEIVSAGQILGCIGTTGTSTGDHLHFGIYLNGEPVNPMQYIG